MKDGTSVMTSAGPGRWARSCKDEHDKGEALYSVPSEGTIVLARHMGDARRRAASQRGVRLAELHPRAGDPGRGDELQLYATPNDAAKEFVDPKILADTAVFPPDE